VSETSTGQEEPVTCTVHGNLRGLRLDQVISQVLPAISTREARQMIMAGNVLSRGVIVRRNYRVREGDSFTVPSPPRHAVAASTSPLPPLSIVYEDDELLVVDKPANVVVHPSYRNPDGTLYDAILAYAASLPHGTLAYRPSLVQRLDKNTSGLLLVAKIPDARRQFQRQLARHSIEKGYLALVHGSPVGDSGTVDLPVGHDPLDRRRMMVRHDGQASVTSWRVVERLPCTTLLRVSPRLAVRTRFGRICWPSGYPSSVIPCTVQMWNRSSCSGSFYTRPHSPSIIRCTEDVCSSNHRSRRTLLRYWLGFAPMMVAVCI